jgi:hypothetical protein
MEAINPLNHYYNLFCLGRLSEKAVVALLLPFLAYIVVAVAGVASRIRFSAALLLLACVFHGSIGLSLFFPHYRLSILSWGSSFVVLFFVSEDVGCCTRASELGVEVWRQQILLSFFPFFSCCWSLLVKTMLENSKGNMKRRIICVMDVAAGRARW